MRVLKGLSFLGFLGETRMGGGNQRASILHFWAILYARITGKPAYLKPIRILIADVCRKIGRGVYLHSVSAKNEGVGSLLPFFSVNSMLKNQ